MLSTDRIGVFLCLRLQYGSCGTARKATWTGGPLHLSSALKEPPSPRSNIPQKVITHLKGLPGEGRIPRSGSASRGASYRGSQREDPCILVPGCGDPWTSTVDSMMLSPHHHHQRCPHPNPQNLRLQNSIAKGGFCRYDCV